jgi:small subunit ribosomal protein S18
MVSKQQKHHRCYKPKIDYKDIDLLTLFVTEQEILPRRATGVTVQQQRKLAKKTIKRARVLALFPFVASNSV